MKEKWESFKETLDDIRSMSKKEFLLVMAVCALGGIVIGMLISPRKSKTLGCYNGDNSGNSGKGEDAIEEETMDQISDWED